MTWNEKYFGLKKQDTAVQKKMYKNKGTCKFSKRGWSAYQATFTADFLVIWWNYY